MTIADHARNQAISLEAKKDALAQRQNGDWKVSFTVQGIDMDTRLTQAPMGTRYAVVLVEIGDDEQPVNRKEAMPNNQSSVRIDAKPRQDNPPSPHPGGAKRPWRDLDPTTQAAMCCNEASFAAFLRETRKDDWIEAPTTADCVRLICGVTSRKELGTNQRARIIWHQLDVAYQAWKALEHA